MKCLMVTVMPLTLGGSWCWWGLCLPSWFVFLKSAPNLYHQKCWPIKKTYCTPLVLEKMVSDHLLFLQTWSYPNSSRRLHLIFLVWSDCFSLRNLTSSYFTLFGLPWVKDHSQLWESQPQALAYQRKLRYGMPTSSMLGVGKDNIDQVTRMVILVRILSFSSWKKLNSN